MIEKTIGTSTEPGSLDGGVMPGGSRPVPAGRTDVAGEWAFLAASALLFVASALATIYWYGGMSGSEGSRDDARAVIERRGSHVCL